LSLIISNDLGIINFLEFHFDNLPSIRAVPKARFSHARRLAKAQPISLLVYYYNLLENKAFISVKEDCCSRECALLLISFSPSAPDIMIMRTETQAGPEYDEFATKFSREITSREKFFSQFS
jgi:hypothetical protein